VSRKDVVTLQAAERSHSVDGCWRIHWTRTTGCGPLEIWSHLLLYLRLLGGLSLEEDAVILSGRAAQKRRLALLALLATAPLRSLSRDKLMGLLWPEKDEDQARHLLSVAVYEIRKELGEEVLQSRGDDLVLDATLLGSDLDDLRLALEEGSLDRATSLYAGPFLDGFFLNGSAEFDQWLEQERDRVAHEMGRAFEDLAERMEAEGDVLGAVDAWRRLAAVDRYNSRIALRLVRALAAAGNRTGALQFARVHVALLQDEFQTEPAPEFMALVETIRSAPAPPGPSAAGPSAAGPSAAPPSAAPPTTPAPAPAPAPTRAPAPAAPDAGAGPGTSPTPDPGSTVQAPSRRPLGRGSYRERQRWNRESWRRLVGRTGSGSFYRIGIVTLLFVVAVGFGAYLQRRAQPVVPPGTAIAVLPFSFSGGVDEAFADGLAEEILWLLGSVSGVRVPVWSASASLRGLGAQEAAARLGVKHVLDGTVRRDNGMLRINVELSDADGMRQWTERYELIEDRHVFRTQADIARAVLRAVEVQLSGAAVAPKQGGTEDVEAYNNYVKGRHAWYKRTPEGFRQAVVYFSDAVAKDPRYARAYAGLADTYSLMGAYDYGVMPPDSAHRLARAAATRALALAPDLAEAHAAMAQVLFAFGRDWAGADEAYRRAIELSPGYAEAHHWYSGYLVSMGRVDEAVAAATRALALDSVSPVMHSSMARQLYYQQDYEAAEAGFHRTLAIDPGYIYGHLGLGLVLIQLGRPDDAAARFAHALEIMGQPHPMTLALRGHALGLAGRAAEAREILGQLERIRASGVFIPPEYPAIVRAGLGEFDAAVAGFEAAYRMGSSIVTVLGVDPLATPLRGHPGFERLLETAAPPRAGL
jgi:DNA-binding SARP family transcriptional activator/TolB-like protein/Tfp pilus assembly protein PilF